VDGGRIGGRGIGSGVVSKIGGFMMAEVIESKQGSEKLLEINDEILSEMGDWGGV
jgi:hypothetical protein